MKKFGKTKKGNKKGKSASAGRKPRRFAPRKARGIIARSAPVAKSLSLTTSFPEKGLRFHHREMCGSVTSTGVVAKCGFKSMAKANGLLGTLADIAVNAGLPFAPWLAHLARPFEAFVFHMLKFTYVPACPTSTPGMVALIPQYDTAASKATLGSQGGNGGEDVVDKQWLLAKTGAVRSSLWSPCTMTVDPKKMLQVFKSHYVRTGDITSGDVKTYDPVRLQVYVEADNSSNDSVALGELWTDYDVTLKIPTMAPVEDPSGHVSVSSTTSIWDANTTSLYVEWWTSKMMGYTWNASRKRDSSGDLWLTFKQTGWYYVTANYATTANTAGACIQPVGFHSSVRAGLKGCGVTYVVWGGHVEDGKKVGTTLGYTSGTYQLIFNIDQTVDLNDPVYMGFCPCMNSITVGSGSWVGEFDVQYLETKDAEHLYSTMNTYYGCYNPFYDP